jgi:hypothetical protein
MSEDERNLLGKIGDYNTIERVNLKRKVMRARTVWKIRTKRRRDRNPN